jgi:hypothetical protein
MICIAAVASARGSELRNYCRRIRSSLPNTKIVVLRPRLTDEDTPRSTERFKEAGADCLVVSAKEAVVAIEKLLPGQHGGLQRKSESLPAQVSRVSR